MAADPSAYSFPSPLEGWEDRSPLPNDLAADGKSYVNTQTGKLSEAYTSFTSPVTNGIRGGFDIHVYFLQTDPQQVHFAKELWERIRREFPELRIYKVWDKPVGPHPIAMFEVNVFTPAQFGAFVSWLVIHRGPLSALVHPNTGDPVRDHSQRASWLGEPYPLNIGSLKKAMKLQQEQSKQG